MDYTNSVDTRTRWSLLLLLAALLAVGFYTTSRETATNDIYWQLAMGRDLVEEGVFPVVDDYSFTANGKEVSNFPFAFQAVSYILVDALGYDAGTHALMFGILALSLLLTLVYLKRVRAEFLVSAMALTGIALFFHFRMLVRPEIGSYLFIIASMILYKMTAADFRVRNLALVVILMFFWVCYHNAVVGYVIFSGLFLDKAIDNIKSRVALNDWWLWFSSGLVVALVGFANPFLKHPVLGTLLSEKLWHEYIIEYQNIFFIFSDYLGAIPLYLLAFVAMLLAIKMKRWGYLFVLFVLFASTISISRLVAASGMVMVLILADMLSRDYDELQISAAFSRAKKLLSPIALGLFLVLLVVALLFQSSGKSNKPADLVKYYQSRGYSGNILNHYDVGGYLIYHLYPDARVFIDGRAGILYEVETYRKNIAAFRTEKNLRDTTEKYQIQHIVAENDLDKNEIIYKSGNYFLDFVDQYFSLYSADNVSFPVAGFLQAFPACWNESDHALIQKELVRAEDLDNLDENFREFVASLDKFGSLTNRQAYYREMTDEVSSNSTVRFVAYQALKSGDIESALTFFSSLVSFQSRDYLAAAYGLYLNQDYETAEQMLDEALQLDDYHIDNADRILLYLLVKNLRKERELTKVPETLEGDLESYLVKQGRDPDQYSLATDLLCGQDRQYFPKVSD